MSAYAVVDGWAGWIRIPCEILGETATKYRVRLLKDAVIPPHRHIAAGDVILVPKHAVMHDE